MVLAVRLCVLLLSPQITQAHALLVRADPQPNAELTQPPAAIHFWFSEPLEATFTGARILTAGGTEIPSAAPRIDPADSTHLTLPLENIEPGIYTVVWQTLSSVDGHEWVGSFPLTILNPDGTRPAGSAVEVTVHHQDGLPPLADSLLRWLSLLSAALLVGPLSIRWLLAGAAARENDEFSLIGDRLSQSIALAGAIGLSAGGWLQLLVQTLRLGGIGEFPELLLATRPGNLVLMRQALLAAVLLLIMRNRLAAVISPLSSGGASSPTTLSGRMRRAAPHFFRLNLGLCVLGLGGTLFYHLNLWILAVAIVVATSILSDLLVRREQTKARVFPKQARATLLTTAALFTFAASSHAAAARGSGWAVAADFAHLVAAAVWAGGLIFLALLLLQLYRLQTVPRPKRVDPSAAALLTQRTGGGIRTGADRSFQQFRAPTGDRQPLQYHLWAGSSHQTGDCRRHPRAGLPQQSRRTTGGRHRHRPTKTAPLLASGGSGGWHGRCPFHFGSGARADANPQTAPANNPGGALAAFQQNGLR